LALKYGHDHIITLNTRSTLSASSQHFLLALTEFNNTTMYPLFVFLEAGERETI